MIEVIIPVGPGHAELAERAEASVCCAIDNYAFDKVFIKRIDDGRGELGRSRARNLGAANSKARWLFWLDADDMMHPNAFGAAEEAMQDHAAVWGTLREQVPGSHYLAERYELPSIRDYAALIKYPPAWTVKIGHFVRREIAAKYPFNEAMNCGEDWDYYLRIWKAERCVKIPAPLYVKIAGQHSAGPRAATGAQWSQTVDALLARARADYAQAA